MYLREYNRTHRWSSCKTRLTLPSNPYNRALFPDRNVPGYCKCIISNVYDIWWSSLPFSEDVSCSLIWIPVFTLLQMQVKSDLFDLAEAYKPPLALKRINTSPNVIRLQYVQSSGAASNLWHSYIYRQWLFSFQGVNPINIRNFKLICYWLYPRHCRTALGKEHWYINWSPSHAILENCSWDDNL